MNIEYKYKLFESGSDDVEECACCRQEAPVHAFSCGSASVNAVEQIVHHYCEICSTTTISNSHQYINSTNTDRAKVLQAIAAVGNIILDKTTDRLEELEKLKGGTQTSKIS